MKSVDIILIILLAGTCCVFCNENVIKILVQTKSGDYLVKTNKKETADTEKQSGREESNNNPNHTGADYADTFTEDDSAFAEADENKADIPAPYADIPSPYANIPAPIAQYAFGPDKGEFLPVEDDSEADDDEADIPAPYADIPASYADSGSAKYEFQPVEHDYKADEDEADNPAPYADKFAQYDFGPDKGEFQPVEDDSEAYDDEADIPAPYADIPAPYADSGSAKYEFQPVEHDYKADEDESDNTAPYVDYFTKYNSGSAKDEFQSLENDTEANEDEADTPCKAIDGPGEGSTCIFPFLYRAKFYTACTLDGDSSVHQFWCSTKVDAEGVHVSGHWGSCSKECPGVEQEGFKERKCESVESGVECHIPFSYKGFTYHGCVRKHEDGKYWCLTKTGSETFCSESCPNDNLLSEIRLSAEDIVAKLKIAPKVFSKIGDGESCEDAIGKNKNMTKICLGANYCSEEKIQSNPELNYFCGSFKISQRMNDPSEGFSPQFDCYFACGAA